ncbi:histidine phosphatase family protein, partial [Mesorhizobium sp. M7A.F.Ca.US.001.01.1.1]
VSPARLTHCLRPKDLGPRPKDLG